MMVLFVTQKKTFCFKACITIIIVNIGIESFIFFDYKLAPIIITACTFYEINAMLNFWHMRIFGVVHNTSRC